MRFYKTILIIALLVVASATQARTTLTLPVTYNDTLPEKKEVKEKDEKTDKEPNGKKPEIKGVPKAKRQGKPLAVGKAVRVRPVKIIKPKIVTKGVGK